MTSKERTHEGLMGLTLVALFFGFITLLIVLAVCTRPASATEGWKSANATTVVHCWGHDRTLVEHAVVASQFWGLPPYLLAGVAEVESGWDPHAENRFVDQDGAERVATGLMQIVPSWHPLMPGGPLDPCASLNYAAFYLRSLIGHNDPRYPEGLPHALARYSGGAEGYADKVLDTMAAYAERARG